MISEVEQTHHKRTARKIFYATGFSFFVLLPTLVAAIYYFFIASNQYVSEIKFSVSVDNSSMKVLGELGGLLPSLSNLQGGHEAEIVKEYISSVDMVSRLQKEIALAKIYASTNPDFFSYPPNPASKKALLDYFQGMTKISLDEQSGILSMEVKAFAPNDAKKIADKILEYAEEFVNKMSTRMQEDSIKFARNEVEKAEKEALYAATQMTGFRNENEHFDPEATTIQVIKITSELEAELAKTKTEIDALSNYMKASSPKIQALKAKANAISSQIASQGSRLASVEGSQLADMLQIYEELKMRQEFAIKKYEMALASFEGAKVEAQKQSKYLLRVVGPTLPSDSTEPNRIFEVLTVFFVCLIGYSVVSLLIEAIKDHIRP